MKSYWRKSIYWSLLLLPKPVEPEARIDVMFRSLFIFCRGVCLPVLLLFAACNAANVTVAVNEANGDSGISQERYRLDTKNRVLTQQLDETTLERTAHDLVEVEVLEVVNPEKGAVGFEVSYETGKERKFIGTFALYPSDKPGKFILRTSGKLEQPGKLILTLTSPDPSTSTDRFHIYVARMRLRKA